jgi:hypothetical protein
MSYVNAKTSTVLNPEYFRKQALAYNANPTDRKQWLQGQIINLQSALSNSSVKIQNLMDQGAKLDGKSNAATWMQAIGGVAISIPTPYTLIGGAVLSAAGIIVGAAERKKDSKALQQLAGQAREIQLEAGQIKTYYDNYTAELERINLVPIALFGTALFIFLQK